MNRAEIQGRFASETAILHLISIVDRIQILPGMIDRPLIQEIDQALQIVQTVHTIPIKTREGIPLRPAISELQIIINGTGTSQRIQRPGEVPTTGFLIEIIPTETIRTGITQIGIIQTGIIRTETYQEETIIRHGTITHQEDMCTSVPPDTE